MFETVRREEKPRKKIKTEKIRQKCTTLLIVNQPERTLTLLTSIWCSGHKKERTSRSAAHLRRKTVYWRSPVLFCCRFFAPHTPPPLSHQLARTSCICYTERRKTKKEVRRGDVIAELGLGDGWNQGRRQERRRSSSSLFLLRFTP